MKAQALPMVNREGLIAEGFHTKHIYQRASMFSMEKDYRKSIWEIFLSSPMVTEERMERQTMRFSSRDMEL